AISLTSWPWVRKRRAQSCAPPQASMPRRTGGSVAIQGIRSCRDKRLRYTTLPLSSLPTAGNTRLAISIPRTYISCFIGLASCGSRGSRIVNALGLIAVDPHRGGSISLRPVGLTILACLPCMVSLQWTVARDSYNNYSLADEYYEYTLVSSKN